MAEVKKVIKLPKLKKLKGPEDKKEEKSEMKSEPYYYDERPEFRIDANDMPEVKDWKVGQEYTVMMKVKMEGLRSRLDDGKEKTCGDFRVISIGAAE